MYSYHLKGSTTCEFIFTTIWVFSTPLVTRHQGLQFNFANSLSGFPVHLRKLVIRYNAQKSWGQNCYFFIRDFSPPSLTCHHSESRDICDSVAFFYIYWVQYTHFKEKLTRISFLKILLRRGDPEIPPVWKTEYQKIFKI